MSLSSAELMMVQEAAILRFESAKNEALALLVSDKHRFEPGEEFLSNGKYKRGSAKTSDQNTGIISTLLFSYSISPSPSFDIFNPTDRKSRYI